MASGRLTRATLLSTMLVAALGGAAVAQSPSPAADTGLAGTAWMLGEMTVDGTTTPIVSGTVVSINFDDEHAGGTTGCNRYVASYTTDGTALTFGEPASTMMLCDDASNALEASYLAALASVASYVQADGALTLSDASGTAVLVYGASFPNSVEGPWNVTSINNGNQGVESVIEGSGLTVSFLEDGTVEGFGGCNGFGGGYSTHDAVIAIGPLTSTMMFCDEAINTQEVQLLTALQAATTWSILDGQLELRDDTGALQVGATSAIGH